MSCQMSTRYRRQTVLTINSAVDFDCTPITDQDVLATQNAILFCFAWDG